MSLVKSIGNIKSFKKNICGIDGKAENGFFQILFYSQNIIKIRVTKEDLIIKKSYAVIKEPVNINFRFEENDNEIIISSDFIKLVITKRPLLFSFQTIEGKIINEDHKKFGISWIGEEVTNYKRIFEDEKFIGLGEKVGGLNKRGKVFTNLNTDAFIYGENTDPLYSTIPFFIGIHNKMCYGYFLDNSYKSTFNFGAANDQFASISAEGGDINYYFIYHENISEIINSYTDLTGKIQMPPLWSLGFHQSRYSYYPDKEVKEIANTFREKKIPIDCIHLDIHYMEKYKVFTWDKINFSKPKELLDELKKLNINITVICDPGIKIDPDYSTYSDGLEKDLYLKYSDGSNYSGQVWPGWCYFPDFSNPKTRLWWGEELKKYIDVGVKGFWNDMNEFSVWGKEMPHNIIFDFDGQKTTIKEGRNVYGMLMNKATFEGLKNNLKNIRPFILTRASYAGGQRYSAIWTGDNVACDEHILLGVSLINSLSICGFSFCGMDIGGFVGNPDQELYKRWITLGAFMPFYRVHTMINSISKEPFEMGEQIEYLSKNYLNLRYELLPYIYSTFYEAHKTGLPINRSLVINHPYEEKIYENNFQYQYYFGKNILVAPVSSRISICKVFLPEGLWYDFHSEKKWKGNQIIYYDCPSHILPIFIKESSIIPYQSTILSTNDKTDGFLILHCYFGTQESEFDYYEDDGESYNFEKGEYYKRKFIFKKNEMILSKVEGSYNTKFNKIKWVLHGFPKLKEITLNTTKYSVNESKISLIGNIVDYDPYENSEKNQEQTVQIVETVLQLGVQKFLY